MIKLINRINRVVKSAFVMLRRSLYIFAPRDPVYIFHHIPKCGGTSVNTVLDDWFITAKDYRSGRTFNYPEKTDLYSLRSCHCLCGHFDTDGYHPHQRYPEVLMDDRYRMFTFVRDPLQVQLSLFRYEKINNRSKANNIEEHLSLRPNYMANRFPATLENYKDVIDRYFFVGILEESQASVDIMASMMGKRLKPLPWENKSTKDAGYNTGSEEIPQDLVTQFRNNNILDYLIYDYCVEKFKQISAEYSPTAANAAVLHGRR